MPLIEKEEILKVLDGYNPWWVTKRVPPILVKMLRRTAYFQAEQLLANPAFQRAVVLAGPRRVGKTTILYQLADAAIRSGVASNQILYITLEHPALKLVRIDELISLYMERTATKGKFGLILLDELQYVERPTQWLKIITDKYPGWRIAVTGSASIVLNGKDKESGVGRWIEVPVPTLSFYEYIRIRESEEPDFDLSGMHVDPSWMPTKIGLLTSEERRRIVAELSPLFKILPDFLLQGGFPETALQHDTGFAQRLLREDIVDKVLKRDMAAFYGIRSLAELEKLFVYLCIHSGSIVNLAEVSKGLGISKPTTYSLLRSLELAHLIRPLHSFDLGGKKALKRSTKWYIVDASIRNAVLLKGSEIFGNPQEMGGIIETSVINHVATFRYPKTPSIGYWKNRKGKEVDLIVNTPDGGSIANEVKYREEISLPKEEGIYSYLSDHEDAVGVVITKNGDDIERRSIRGNRGRMLYVSLIPAHVFLYLLGSTEYMRNAKRNSSSFSFLC